MGRRIYCRLFETERDIAAPCIAQWAGIAMREALNGTHEDDMIARVDDIGARAIEPGDGAIDQRISRSRCMPGNGREFVSALRGKDARYVLLALGQDVDGKALRLSEGGATRRGPGNADEKEWRIERDGGEGI